MRRKDRVVNDLLEMKAIIDKCDVCRLGLSENNKPYVVPLNFGYEMNKDKLTLFFHCASEGKKLEIIKINPDICFEMDCGHQIVYGKTDCSCSMGYESIIGHGVIQVIENKDSKIHGLSKIMEKATGKPGFNFDEEMVKNVVVLKLTTSDFIGKRHRL